MRTAVLLLLPLVLWMFSVTVKAVDLSQRVAEAKVETATASGAKYDQSLGPFIGEAMRVCITPGSTSPENLGLFTLVARVSANGTQTEVEVEPETSVSACFKRRFAVFKLPGPPNSAARRLSVAGYPIVVEIRVTP